jgi:hypothetical protein
MFLRIFVSTIPKTMGTLSSLAAFLVVVLEFYGVLKDKL